MAGLFYEWEKKKIRGFSLKKFQSISSLLPEYYSLQFFFIIIGSRYKCVLTGIPSGHSLIANILTVQKKILTVQVQKDDRSN